MTSITGASQVIAALKSFPRNMQNRSLRPAITAAARLVAKTAKQYAPKGESGELKRSIDEKVKAYGPLVIVGMAGAKNSPTMDARGRPINPAHYAHLVELGHAGPKPAPAHPFLRPALDTNQTQIERVIVQKVSEQIKRMGTR
jgi:HK97 gp10 family phage protein